MRHYLAIYRASLKTYIAIELQYRVAMLIWLIGLVIEPIIYITVWGTVATSTGGTVGGFSGADLAGYFIVTMWVNHLTFTWIMWEYEFYIRQGILAPRLLKPLHPIHHDIAANLSYKILTLIVLIPLTGVFILVFRPALAPEPWAILVFIPSIILAFLARFMLEYTFALAAFWTTRIAAINQLYYVTLLFMSGRISPLALLPDWLQTIATVLPFRWFIAFPAELLLGRVTPQAALQGLVMQGVWLAVGLLLFNVIWRAAIKRFSAVGA